MMKKIFKNSSMIVFFVILLILLCFVFIAANNKKEENKKIEKDILNKIKSELTTFVLRHNIISYECRKGVKCEFADDDKKVAYTYFYTGNVDLELDINSFVIDVKNTIITIKVPEAKIKKHYIEIIEFFNVFDKSLDLNKKEKTQIVEKDLESKVKNNDKELNKAIKDRSIGRISDIVSIWFEENYSEYELEIK